MGLDMYLTAKKYIAGDKELTSNLNSSNGFLKAKTVEYEIIYWRKANAIHNWFVNNCQQGIDNCQQVYVDKDNLKNLLDIIESLLKNKSKDEAMEKLPPKSGFFFGETQINEYYWEDLEMTKEKLIEIFKPEYDELDLYYRASW